MLDDDYRLPHRRLRAQALAAVLMNALHPYLRSDPDDRVIRDAYDKILALLHEEGVEILTDHTRAQLGLPRRDEKGWTAEEILALEEARIAALRAPIFAPRPDTPLTKETL